MATYTLGIDIGTSSVKAGLLELISGRLEFVSHRRYDKSAEQSTRVLWENTLEVLKEVGAYISKGQKIAAIGMSGQMHGTVMYMKSGQVMESLINWQDKRCDQPLAKYQGKSTIDIISGRLEGIDLSVLGIDRMASGFLGATLFYIKENDAHIFGGIRFVTLPTDFIRGKLLGKPNISTDPTNAASTGLLDITRCWYHREVLKCLGLQASMLPRLHSSRGTAGFVNWEISEMIGFPYTLGVIYGGGDLQMSVLGSGLTAPGSPDLLNIGTGAQIARITGSFKKLPGIDTWPFFDRDYVHVGASLGGGASYQWLRDMLRSKHNTGITYKEMDELAGRVSPGTYGLRFCTGPTRQEPKRELGFYGNLSHLEDTGCMARAVLEGVLFDLYGYYLQMGEQDQVSMVGAGNGLCNSQVWSQMAADMFNRKMLVVDSETAVYGAALLAGSRLPEYEDLQKAAGKITYSTFEADRENAAIYQELVENYLDKQT